MAAVHQDGDYAIRHEVDNMILEYFCYRAIQAILMLRRAELNDESLNLDVEMHLSLFSTFKQLVTRNHVDQSITGDLQRKLQLLTVTNLLFFRNRNSNWAQSHQQIDHKLHDQDEQNILLRLGDIWPGESWSLPPLDTPELENNYFETLTWLKIPPRHASSRQNATSLLDILPDFMALCALMTPLIEQEKSMEIAASFMKFASLEQYFILGRGSSNFFAETFAWGSPSPNNPTATDTPIDSPTRLWRQKRIDHIKFLLPREGSAIQTQYWDLWMGSSLRQFEEKVLDYLDIILTRLTIPVLSQVEYERSKDFDRS